ncbi:MAG: hypothetical protein KIT11_05585 [Fimbriimonadaceae bacterium]|nr:hypothetical protein [Fimbriimonadaceae bacterium]QYK56636.1 MAG: hypothetical protein KF733_03935 [Fimbriimonadaceae bacterium]
MRPLGLSLLLLCVCGCSGPDVDARYGSEPARTEPSKTEEAAKRGRIAVLAALNAKGVQFVGHERIDVVEGRWEVRGNLELAGRSSPWRVLLDSDGSGRPNNPTHVSVPEFDVSVTVGKR